jgi:hypothetical protein
VSSTPATTTATEAQGSSTIYTSNNTTSIVLNTDIQTALNAGTSVILQTLPGGNASLGNITVGAPITMSAVGAVTAASLTLNAYGSIIINKPINSTGGALALTLDADTGAAGGSVSIAPLATITTNGGDLIIGGGANPLTGAAIGTSAIGVNVAAALDAGGGNITINGTGYSGATSYSTGIHQSAAISTSGTGTITLFGTGGGSGAGEVGYYSTASTTAFSGNISIIGVGGGTGVAGSNSGVVLTSGGGVQSNGGGTISVTGAGGVLSTGNANNGVYLNGASPIQSSAGNISVNGTGGGTGGSTTNDGVLITGSGSALKQSGAGGVIVLGFGGGTGTGGSNVGVLLTSGGSVQSSGGGAISVTGNGGVSSAGNANYGVYLNGASAIQSTAGAISINGAGGGTGGSNTNYGVLYSVANSIQSNGGGAITIVGYGGDPDGIGSSNIGVTATAALATVGGAISITGTGGNSSGTSNYGIRQTGAINTNGTGGITLSGTGGGSGTNAIGYSSTAITATAGGDISITGTPGNSTGSPVYGISMGSVAAGTGAVTLTSTGAVISSGALTAAGLNLLGAGGNYVLTNAGNAVTTLAANTGAVTYSQTPSLTIGTVGSTAGMTTSGALSVATAGDLTVAASSPVSGVSPSLAAGGAFINNEGPGAVTAIAGNWLIYSANPTGDTFGPVSSDNNLNSNNTAVWNTAPGATVTATGNRYVFAFQPTVTFTSLDATNVYGIDGTAVVAASYGVTGLQPALANVYLADSAGIVYGGAPSVTSAGSAATASVALSPYNVLVAAGNLASLDGYALAYASPGSLTVTPASLSVTADTLSRLYGAANQTLTYTATGLVNGDTASSTFAGGLTTAATAASNVGPYAITQGTLTASSNYAPMAFTGANLTVNPASLSVTADTLNRLYGAANPILTYTAAGLVNGDTPSGTFSGGLTTAATAASGVGPYAITQGTLAASTNYSLTYTGANLTVNPASLSVTADALGRLYGAANPTLTYTAAGLVNGDTPNGTFSGGLTTAATAASDVGPYAITQGTLATSPNYTLSLFSGANLTVGPAPLTIVADNSTKTQSAVNPPLSASATGFANGQSVTNLSGALVLTTAANLASTVGAYPIVPSGYSSINYSISYLDGVLSVVPNISPFLALQAGIASAVPSQTFQPVGSALSAATAPMTAATAPMSAATASVIDASTPVNATTASVIDANASMGAAATAVSAANAPVSSETAPVSTAAAPMSTATAPASTAPAPASTAPAPTSAAAAPVSAAKAPAAPGSSKRCAGGGAGGGRGGGSPSSFSIINSGMRGPTNAASEAKLRGCSP